MIEITEEIKIDRKTIGASLHDMAKCAAAAELVYVTNDKPGITRKRIGKNFFYFNDGEKIKNKDEIVRIKKLGIPPAWTNVWICKLPNGHLQATGIDSLNRKQYRYHTSWSLVRKYTKFYRLYQFGKQIPIIRTKVEEHLSLTGFPQEKVLAAVVSLLESTSIRIGNSIYEKLYGSFGLTTLKNRHVTITGTKIRFAFKGKKGISHNITLRSQRLARIIKQCKDMPGKELFEFYDDEGNIHSIDSGMVNTYLRNISEGDFTAKDFRTWVGTVRALVAFNEVGRFESTSEMNQKIAAAFDSVAKQLGNTRAVCKSHYVHPLIVDLYKENKLEKYFRDLKANKAIDEQEQLIVEEKLLLKILKQH